MLLSRQRRDDPVGLPAGKTLVAALFDSEMEAREPRPEAKLI